MVLHPNTHTPILPYSTSALIQHILGKQAPTQIGARAQRLQKRVGYLVLLGRDPVLSKLRLDLAKHLARQPGGAGAAARRCKRWDTGKGPRTEREGLFVRLRDWRK